MTPSFFRSDIPTYDMRDEIPSARPSLENLFEDVFARQPAAKASAKTCEPFSNDTPPPSGQTMREPPEEKKPKRPTLHLPTCPKGEPGNTTQIGTPVR